MIPAIGLFLGRIPPWAWRGLAIVAALGALWIWHAGKVSAAYDKGAADTDAGWQEEAARLRAVAAQQAMERQAAVDSAEVADSERAAMLTRLMAPINVKVTAYEKSERGRVVCLDDDGRLLARQAIAAANASIASGSGAPSRKVPAVTK